MSFQRLIDPSPSFSAPPDTRPAFLSYNRKSPRSSGYAQPGHSGMTRLTWARSISPATWNRSSIKYLA